MGDRSIAEQSLLDLLCGMEVSQAGEWRPGLLEGKYTTREIIEIADEVMGLVWHLGVVSGRRIERREWEGVAMQMKDRPVPWAP
jgi:hypothetical protein